MKLVAIGKYRNENHGNIQAVGSASKVKYYLPLVWHASSQFVEITAAVTSHNARRLGLVRRGCFNSG